MTTVRDIEGVPNSVSAGHMIVKSLAQHGVERVYVVPGESYLDVLDGLHDSDIETVVCRHEGGAAYMAEADGKMNPVPGIAMVTRGPGAANAHVGLHTAWQDSTAMVLFVGLIPFEHREKEAFQEFDPKAWFDSGAKRVMILDHAERASEIVAEAMFAAASGRPGPVVVGLPEDIIKMGNDGVLHPRIPIAEGGMTVTDWKALKSALLDAERPLFVFGGNDWTHPAAEEFTAWLESHNLPAAAEWRCEGTVPFTSPSYVGPLGYGRPHHTRSVLEDSDLLVFVGTVPGDVITDGGPSDGHHSPGGLARPAVRSPWMLHAPPPSGPIYSTVLADAAETNEEPPWPISPSRPSPRSMPCPPCSRRPSPRTGSTRTGT